MPNYETQIVLLHDAAKTPIFTLMEKQEKLRILTGQGFPKQPNQSFPGPNFKQTFNFFSLESLPDALDSAYDENKPLGNYLDKQQLRKHCDFIVNRPVLAAKRQFPYSAPELAQYLIENSYNFQLDSRSTDSQILGKRTAEDAFGYIEREYVKIKMPPIIYTEEQDRQSQIDSDLHDLYTTKSSDFSSFVNSQ